MDAARQFAQFHDRGLGLLAGASDQRARALGIAGDPRLDESQRERHGNQALLGAVVEVALDAPALGVGGVDDAPPRVPQVMHALAQRTRAAALRRLAREADLRHRLSSVCEAPHVPTARALRVQGCLQGGQGAVGGLEAA